MLKKQIILVLFLVPLLLLGGCGEKESPGKFYLTENEVNYFKLDEGTTDLSALGTAINGTKDMIVALDADNASTILDSLKTIGEVSATNFSMEFNLNGKGDYSKIGNLSSIQGLTSLTVAGINKNDDVSFLQKLPNLEKLTLRDQVISDYSPLSQCKNLKTLSITGENTDYSTLTTLPMENVEIPVTDNNWVALSLIKENQGIATINSVNREQFYVRESLEGEKNYYNLQFDPLAYVTKKRQEITASGGDAQPTISGEVILAGTKDLLQKQHYTDQKLLNTLCGFPEEDKEPKIFYPYMKDYTEEDTEATMIHLAGTAFMDESFMTGVIAEDAPFIFYVYATDAQGKFTTDYTTEGLKVHGQFYDVKKAVAYPAVTIYETPLADVSAGGAYQNEILYNINEVLKGYTVKTL